MWDLNTKQMNQQNQTKPNSYRKEIAAYQKENGLGRWVTWVKGLNFMVLDGNQIYGVDHFVMYTNIWSVLHTSSLFSDDLCLFLVFIAIL